LQEPAKTSINRLTTDIKIDMIKFSEDFAVVLMHLPSRTDRLPLIERVRNLIGCGEVVAAYSPETAPPKIHPHMHDKRWAITSSKHKALEYALSQGKKYILFMEDDCDFENDTVNRLQNAINAAPDFDIMYAGWSCWSNAPGAINSPVFQWSGNGTVVCTHCVLFTAAAASAIVKTWDYAFFDECYSLLGEYDFSSDQMLSHFIKKQNWKCYLCYPQIAHQRGGKSDNWCENNSNDRDYPEWYPAIR